MAQKQEPETHSPKASLPDPLDFLLSVPLGFFTSTLKGRHLSTNPTLARVLGYKNPEELTGAITNIATQIYANPEERQEFMRLMQEHGKVVNYECQFKRKDGSIVWISRSARAVFDDQGNVLHYQGSNVDITERKQAEQALLESEEKHRRLFETMNQGVIYQAADGAIISANPAAERILGLTFDQMQGKTSMDPRWKMITEDGTEISGTDHPTMIALRTGKPVGPVVRGVFHPDKNAHIWLSITAIPLFLSGEAKPYQAYATIEDITDSKRTEEALTSSHALLSAAMESTTDGLLIINSNRKIARYNQKFIDMWSIPQEIIASQDDAATINYVLSQLVDPESFLTKVDHLYAHPEESSFDELEFTDGRFLERYSQPLTIGTDFAGRVWSFRDITERKEAEAKTASITKQLQHLLNEKDKLFSIIAHDLKSPMSGLLSLSKMFANDVESLSIKELQNIASAMHKSSEQLYALMINLLQWALMQQGVMKYSPRTQRLHKLVHAGIDPLRSVSEQKQVTLQSRIQDDLVVRVDAQMITTVVRNLVSNALKYTDSGGNVTIAATLDQGKVRISVQDSGVGMDQSTRDGIFSLDKKASHPGTRGESGTGLGLVLCKQFVDQHNGHIWVESEVGKGTTVYFTLPVNDEIGETNHSAHPCESGLDTRLRGYE